ncbi:hypothetical protein F4809DRAFT_636839 [Biscogniauxia mediterranea]|nr:hypothetical protein F4809DRAFT_636839 [Biscogniauxia mediterranea]
MPQSPDYGFKLYFPQVPSVIAPVEHPHSALPMDGSSMSNAQRSAKAEAAERCGWRPDSPEQTHDNLAGRCADTHRTPEPEEVCSWQDDPPEPTVDNMGNGANELRSQLARKTDAIGLAIDQNWNGMVLVESARLFSRSNNHGVQQGSRESPGSEGQIAAPEPKSPRSPLLENILSIGNKRKSAPEIPQIVIPTHEVPSSAPQSTTTEANPFLDPSLETQSAGAEPEPDEEDSLSGKLSRTFRDAFGAVLGKIRTSTPPPAEENTDTSGPQPQPPLEPLHPPSGPTTQLPLSPQPNQAEDELTPAVPIPEELPERSEKQGKPKKDKAAEKEEKAKAKEAKARARKDQKAEKKKEKERVKHEKRKAKHEEHETKCLEHETKHKQKEAKHGKRKDKGRREKKKGKASEATAHEPCPPGGPHARCEMCQSNEEETKYAPIKDLMSGWESLPSFGELAEAAKKLIARKDVKATTEPPAENDEPDYDVLVEHVADHIAEHVHQRLSSSDNQPRAAAAAAEAPRHPCGKLAIDGLEHTCGARCSPASHGLDGNRDSPTPAGASQVVRSSPPTRRDSLPEAAPVVVRPSRGGALTFPAVNTPIDRAMSPWNQRLGLKKTFDWGPFSRSTPLTPYPAQGCSREASSLPSCHHHFCVPVMPMISSLCLETRCPYDVSLTPAATPPHFLGGGGGVGVDYEKAVSAAAAAVVNVTPPGLAETLPPNSPPRTPSPNGSGPTATTLRMDSLRQRYSESPASVITSPYGVVSGA